MQQDLFSLSINQFIVSAMLDTGAMQLFVIHKLAEKLLATIQTMIPWLQLCK